MTTASVAHAFWAAHVGVPPERLFAEPTSIVTHAGDLDGYHGVFALFRNGSRLVSLPPRLAAECHEILSALPSNYSAGHLAHALRPLAGLIVGPAYVGYLDHPSVVPLPAATTRALTELDLDIVNRFKDACDPTEWEHGGSEVRLRPTSGAFIDGELAAMAGYDVWGRTIAHLAIITHPAHRGRGMGRAAVAHLAARASAVGLLPQYRTLDSNLPSLRIAQALGFERYATTLAVRLK